MKRLALAGIVASVVLWAAPTHAEPVPTSGGDQVCISAATIDATGRQVETGVTCTSATPRFTG